MLRLFSSVILPNFQRSDAVRRAPGHFSRIWPYLNATAVPVRAKMEVTDENSFSVTKAKLIVFDLDYTLWPFWVDTHVDPPFKMASNGKVYDAHGQHVAFYPDVPAILERLHREGCILGIASRTGAVSEASDLLRLFNWDKYFQYRQIYPGCKITHFKKLRQQSGVDYKDMIFFDDEHQNIHDVSSLGVTCILCDKEGVSNKVLHEGFELFKHRRGTSQNKTHN